MFVNFVADVYSWLAMNALRALLMLAAIASAPTACGPQHPYTPGGRTGALAKLKPEQPKSISSVSFVDAAGKPHALAEFHGRYVLLNLWATWCAPCVRELPALAHLQAAVVRKHLLVIPVSVGRETAAATAAFLKQHHAQLPVYIDTQGAFLHAFGAFGLPLTVLIDPKGREIARASGAVHWDATDSIGYFEQLEKS